jgi:hypothetical protein
MPLSRSLVLGFVIATVSPLLSEEPVPKPLDEPVPTAPAAPSKTPAPEPEQALPRGSAAARSASKPSLLPDEIPAYARQPAVVAPAVAKTGTPATPLAATASEIDLRIRYRKARNIAESNEKVRAAWDESRTMKTDDGKRRALKRYQDLLYAKMLSIDRGIAPLVEQRRKSENYLLDQTQITRTVPVE